MLYEHAVSGSVFRGACLETDFASMLAWRNWDFPDPGVKNCFAMGVLRARDGAFLLGVMGAHTANAGKVYFPAGLPDPSDIAGAQVDLARTPRRCAGASSPIWAARRSPSSPISASRAGPPTSIR
jgi:hypothetical protein